ncbi:hypothetical protein [Bradyrhizobium sp. Ai1a-2]|uniref:hypothetical protein n=1 Tax=Bradyrhizobium sp. Ai1a-2 TaxID=196490 RepID=UPI000423FA81|nr:hypothetical protein [Bradyrhizobium sp. Ai1a-2]
MAALLKEHETEQWSQPVSNEGFAKLLQAIEEPKKPSEALKRLMLSYKKSK